MYAWIHYNFQLNVHVLQMYFNELLIAILQILCMFFLIYFSENKVVLNAHKLSLFCGLFEMYFFKY